MSTFTVSAVFQAVDRFSQPMRQMERSMVGFGDAAQSTISMADRGFRRLVPSLNSATKDLLSFASAAALLLELRNQFKKIQEFEDGLVGVGKTADLSGKELQTFGQQIIETSNALKSISTEKLLEVSQSAGQLGIKGSDNILKFASTLTLLEKASDVVGDEGAKSIARILNITGESVQTVDKFASSLVALGNNSAASESEILSMANEVSRATSSFKLASSEVLGISAALTSLGAKPESAGSAVGKLFAQIEKSTIKGGKQMKAFSKVMGIGSDEIKKLFGTDKTKLFTLFAKGISNIQKGGGSLITTFEDLGISGERAIKGLGPMASNYEIVAKSMSIANTEFEKNTALNIEAEKALNTVSSAAKAVRISFDNLITSAFNSNDGFSVLKSTLFFVADNMGTLVKIGVAYITGLIAIKAALIAAKIAMVAYNVVLGVATALQGKSALALVGNTTAYVAYRVAMVAGSVAMGIATAAQWLLNAALTANPIGIVIVLVGALVAALVWLVSQSEAVAEAFSAAIDFIVGLFKDAIEFIYNLFIKPFVKVFTWLVDWFKGLFPRAFEAMKDMFLGFLDWLFDFFIQPFVDAWDWLTGLFGDDMDTSGLDKINDTLDNMDKTMEAEGTVNVNRDPINSGRDNQDALVRSLEIQRQNLDININNGVGDSLSIESTGDTIATPIITPSFGL